MEFTEAQKQHMYRFGQWGCPAPPVYSGFWNEAAWIKWIDTHNGWEADRPKMCEFYPLHGTEPICDCGSDISGAKGYGLCTVAYSQACQWAQERRQRT